MCMIKVGQCKRGLNPFVVELSVFCTNPGYNKFGNSKLWIFFIEFPHKLCLMFPGNIETREGPGVKSRNVELR